MDSILTEFRVGILFSMYFGMSRCFPTRTGRGVMQWGCLTSPFKGDSQGCSNCLWKCPFPCACVGQDASLWNAPHRYWKQRMPTFGTLFFLLLLVYHQLYCYKLITKQFMQFIIQVYEDIKFYLFWMMISQMNILFCMKKFTKLF